MRRIAVLSVFVLGVVTTQAQACSACGCTLSSDWASQGFAASGGWRFDVRYDYFEQDELRSGTDKVARSSLSIPADQEIQRYTINRNVAASLDYSPGKNWGFNATLPWFDRPHATIAAGDSAVSTSRDTGVGDLRLVARYAGFDAQRSTGLLFGIKLPTGHFTDTFDAGPQRGETVDRGLQLGSGTTDAIVGIYKFGALSPDWGYFGQALLQQPLDSRAGFKPGTGVNLNFGVRYTAIATFEPQLQLNARIEKREQGINADVENSGATLVYLSPGITWNPTRRLSLYAFVQAPLYQRVNGLQLEATQFASMGMHYHF